MNKSKNGSWRRYCLMLLQQHFAKLLHLSEIPKSQHYFFREKLLLHHHCLRYIRPVSAVWAFLKCLSKSVFGSNVSSSMRHRNSPFVVFRVLIFASQTKGNHSISKDSRLSPMYRQVLILYLQLARVLSFLFFSTSMLYLVSDFSQFEK